MSEETKSTEQQEPVVSNAAVRESPLFKRLAKELDELRGAVSQKTAAEEQARKDAELKNLEARGQYEAIVAQLKRENEAQAKAHAEQVLRLSLQSELVRAGATNRLWLAGAVSGYSGDADGIAAYVAELQAADADMFGAQQKSQPIPPASTSTPAAGKTNWASVKADLASKDPAKAAAASKSVTAYFAENGKLPW